MVDTRTDALVQTGSNLVADHLNESLRTRFREDYRLSYPELGREARIMYVKCSLDFQRAHMDAMNDGENMRRIVKRSGSSGFFSPWATDQGFYVSCYRNFVVLWHWMLCVHNSRLKILVGRGWDQDSAPAVLAYAQSIGRLEERIKHLPRFRMRMDKLDENRESTQAIVIPFQA